MASFHSKTEIDIHMTSTDPLIKDLPCKFGQTYFFLSSIIAEIFKQPVLGASPCVLKYVKYIIKTNIFILILLQKYHNTWSMKNDFVSYFYNFLYLLNYIYFL